MRWLRNAPRAVWEFVVGDDWRIAAGVALALGLTAIVAALGVSAWWVMPVAVVLVLWLSLAGALPRPLPRPLLRSLVRALPGARSSQR